VGCELCIVAEIEVRASDFRPQTSGVSPQAYELNSEVRGSEV